MSSKIVFVDDESSVIAALKREIKPWCKEKGVEALFFTSPLEVESYITKNHRTIALLVTDLNMPEMNGTELIARVSRVDDSIMFILLTAFTNPEEINQMMKSGVFSFLLKPWEGNYLIRELEKALSVYRIRRENRTFYERMEEELLWAGELQKTLLKHEIPAQPEADVDVLYRPLPALHCGGDYYDVFPLSEKGILAVIGDVSGHGVRGAFITAMLKSFLYKDFVRKQESLQHCGDFLTRLNRRLSRELERLPDIIVTFCAVYIDYREMVLHYGNAGHVPLYLLRGRTLHRIHYPSPALNMSDDYRFPTKKVRLKEGDRIILVTDGLAEEADTGGLHTHEVWQTVAAECDKSSSFNKCLVQKMRERRDNDFGDDVTALTIKFKGVEDG